jgi:hypothetical protein
MASAEGMAGRLRRGGFFAERKHPRPVLAPSAAGRLIPRPMRPVICKCPNHNGCLLGYHGDDIEITRDMPLVCPECGTPVKLAPKPRNDLFYRVLNLIGLATVAGAIWFAWPSLVLLWKKVTTPPQRTAPAKR